MSRTFAAFLCGWIACHLTLAYRYHWTPRTGWWI